MMIHPFKIEQELLMPQSLDLLFIFFKNPDELA